MGVLTTQRRELKNARVYFIPAGEVVDTVTTSVTTWPDANPLTNYTAFQFQDIETLNESKEFDTEVFKIPKAAGAYVDDEEQTLKKRIWTAVTSKTNSLLKQLEHALASVPVVGTAQAPGLKNDNSIEGVMLVEIQLKNGTISERWQVWAKLRLVTPGEVGPTTSKLEISFEQRDSGNNTYLLVA